MISARKPTLRQAVQASKYVIVAVAAFTAVTSAASASNTDGLTATQETVAEPVAGQPRLDRLISRHDCSVTGYGADVIPGSSLVLQDGEVRHVSFDEGWAVYTGEQSGTLLAVCRSIV